MVPGIESCRSSFSWPHLFLSVAPVPFWEIGNVESWSTVGEPRSPHPNPGHQALIFQGPTAKYAHPTCPQWGRPEPLPTPVGTSAHGFPVEGEGQLSDVVCFWNGGAFPVSPMHDFLPQPAPALYMSGFLSVSLVLCTASPSVVHVTPCTILSCGFLSSVMLLPQPSCPSTQHSPAGHERGRQTLLPRPCVSLSHVGLSPSSSSLLPVRAAGKGLSTRFPLQQPLFLPLVTVADLSPSSASSSCSQERLRARIQSHTWPPCHRHSRASPSPSLLPRSCGTELHFESVFSLSKPSPNSSSPSPGLALLSRAYPGPEGGGEGGRMG